MLLFDDHFRPQRLVGKIARRLIGRQKLTWTPAQLAGVEQGEAFAVMLMLAASDAER